MYIVLYFIFRFQNGVPSFHVQKFAWISKQIIASKLKGRREPIELYHTDHQNSDEMEYFR